jgi:N6-adenosine-specific RNA methylase IME4
MTRYRTIVADPPWKVHKGVGFGKRTSYSGPRMPGDSHIGEDPTPYDFMEVEDIAALPVGTWAAPDAHLYLWTINAFVEDAYDVARAWGFRPVQLLTWTKRPMGIGLGGAFTSTTEFVLFCRRGKLPTQTKVDSTWFPWQRRFPHSTKPEGLQDVVEQISPGPYLELFARRGRLGWDSWGNESFGSADLEGVA